MSTNNQNVSGGISLSITTPLTLESTDFVKNITLIAISGALTMKGPSKFRGQDSQNIVLPEGSIVTLSGQAGGILVGWVFTPAGTVGVIINQ